MAAHSTNISEPSSFTDHFVKTSLGDVHFRRGGEGPPLVLLHSNGLSWHEFEMSLQPLAERFDVIAWDMPGQGDSSPVSWDTSIDSYADAVSELITELGIRRPLVAGCSVGAFIAVSLASRRPEQLAGLVLAEFQTGGAEWFARNWDTVEALFGVPSMSFDQVQARLARPVGDDVAQRWNIDRNKAGSRSMMGVMWAIRRFDIMTALESLEVPVVALFGDAGPTIANAGAVEQVLGRQASIHTVPGAGHFVSVDQPDRFTKSVIDLADRIAN
ncbi:alpha/beta hydrolase [Rhodococcus pseudokoreensis]|uniref:Alpha/beta hydrolase n=1 Tax=Rhodococcus pseudokoreensis TaxID=2811421 RepID=A0A974W3N6_9NOCA|nr:alpha/beta hydrolase [Rhodococcus pseudokoreensis]QSE90659.1 alpha/beta hydrolase [Rhodococcus pseudokoreensis]